MIPVPYRWSPKSIALLINNKSIPRDRVNHCFGLRNFIRIDGRRYPCRVTCIRSRPRRRPFIARPHVRTAHEKEGRRERVRRCQARRSFEGPPSKLRLRRPFVARPHVRTASLQSNTRARVCEHGFLTIEYGLLTIEYARATTAQPTHTDIRPDSRQNYIFHTHERGREREGEREREREREGGRERAPLSLHTYCTCDRC